MTPLVASMIVGGIGASMPYLWEGGRALADYYGYDQPEGDLDLSPMLRAEEEASRPYEQYLSDEISRLERTGGAAVGAGLAASGKSGLASVNPAIAAMMRQGEISGTKAAGGLRREQAMHPMLKFQEQQDRARADITAIMANYDQPRARSSRIDRLGDAYAGTPQASMYKAWGS